MTGRCYAFVDLPNWLGDFLHTLPALKRLLESGRGEVTVALPPTLVGLARVVGATAVPRPPGAGGRWLRRTLSANFQVALTARHSTRAKLLLAAAPAARRLASRGRGAALVGLETFAVERARHQRHDLDAALLRLGLAPVDDRPIRLHLPEALKHGSWRWRARCGGGAPLAVLLPGSSHHPAKRYPLSAYCQVAQLLHAAGVTPLAMGGPGDETLASTLAQVPGVRLAPLGLPAELAAALLAECDVAIGNDSGLAHLAAAVGCPTVVLYGPTDPARTAPVGEATVLATGAFRGEASWASVPPSQVVQVALSLLEGGETRRGLRDGNGNGIMDAAVGR